MGLGPAIDRYAHAQNVLDIKSMSFLKQISTKNNGMNEPNYPEKRTWLPRCMQTGLTCQKWMLEPLT